MHLDTIIVEDEPLSRQYLASLLKQFCPEVNLAGSVATEQEAVTLIRDKQPQLVFLDIELTMGSGFDVLRNVRDLSFHAVFTTALDHHALNLIRLSGTDFLQKPIDIEELQAAVRKALTMRQEGERQSGVCHLLESLDHHHRPVHIVVNGEGKEAYVKLGDIIRIEAAAQHTTVVLAGEPMRSRNTLKDWEDLLGSYGFLRIHQHHLINIKQTRAGIEGDVVRMSDGSSVPLSPKKKESLQEALSVLPGMT